ncbi:MAG: SRPBCC domain-containing protein, partial [Vicinamibacteria bacterium]
MIDIAIRDTRKEPKPSDNEIVLTRTFAAPRETVFAALTQAEHLVRWMKPTDIALVACEVDLRAGGTFRYVFQ